MALILFKVSELYYEIICSCVIERTVFCMKDYIEAHQFSNNHMEQLKNDGLCGCFYCLEIFSPSEINEWIIDDIDCDRYGTAICPYCGINSVIGESSGYPITKKFLTEMKKYWF